MQIIVILPTNEHNWQPFAFLGDGSINQDFSINPPMDSTDRQTITLYTELSKHAVIKNQLFIFGGVLNSKRVITIFELSSFS